MMIAPKIADQLNDEFNENSMGLTQKKQMTPNTCITLCISWRFNCLFNSYYEYAADEILSNKTETNCSFNTDLIADRRIFLIKARLVDPSSILHSSFTSLRFDSTSTIIYDK